MDRTKLVEELAITLSLDRFPELPWIDQDSLWQENYRGHARACLARLDALGLVVVERTPSEAMAEAGRDAYNWRGEGYNEHADKLFGGNRVFQAMLAASSTATQGKNERACAGDGLATSPGLRRDGPLASPVGSLASGSKPVK